MRGEVAKERRRNSLPIRSLAAATAAAAAVAAGKHRCNSCALATEICESNFEAVTFRNAPAGRSTDRPTDRPVHRRDERAGTRRRRSHVRPHFHSPKKQPSVGDERGALNLFHVAEREIDLTFNYTGRNT